MASTAADIADAVRQLAPDAGAVVGMSLGELTTAITAFVDGPVSFASFDDLLARTMEHNPTRSEASLRRGSCTTPCSSTTARGCVVSGLTVSLLLVRGMRPQSVIDDADEAELVRRLPSATVAHVADAGHSVQGDTPVELARLIDDFI